jgi:hypothetical protein
LLSEAFFVDLQQQHARYSEAVTVWIKNRLAFGQFPGDPIKSFVGMIFGERTTAPLKKPHQFAASFEILLAGALAIRSERGQQSVK